MAVLDKFKLEGKVAIVTGVSSGLGIAFAEGLAEAGADVVVVARRADKLEASAKRIAKKTKRKIMPMTCDVSKEEDIIRVVKATEKKFGKIDVLVNNAGVAALGPSHLMKEEDWDRVVSINLTGTFLFSKHVIASMLAKKRKGSIINLASIYGLEGDIFPAAPYYATKGAVVNLTRSLAIEYAKRDIRINAIAPGFFPSEMTGGIFEDKNALGHIVERTPMGRVGDPEELKGAVVYLASEAASYVTGHTLTVDGGWNAE